MKAMQRKSFPQIFSHIFSCINHYSRIFLLLLLKQWSVLFLLIFLWSFDKFLHVSCNTLLVSQNSSLTTEFWKVNSYSLVYTLSTSLIWVISCEFFQQEVISGEGGRVYLYWHLYMIRLWIYDCRQRLFRSCLHIKYILKQKYKCDYLLLCFC